MTSSPESPQSSRPIIHAIVVAAGTGTRAGHETPKQFCKIAGKALLNYSLEAFSRHSAITKTWLVIGNGQEQYVANALSSDLRPAIVIGGMSRRESVRNALTAISSDADGTNNPSYVLIHDAARPFLSADIISALISELATNPAVVPALPIVDSLAGSDDGVMTSTLERGGVLRIQTPQAFDFSVISTAHDRWPEENEATDDARMVQAIGKQVKWITGDEKLSKITYADDFERAEREVATAMITRTGMGFDVHRLVEGKPLWLGGVNIPHDRGLDGHSDADVALHALTDAVLGAVAEGDIGDHFPPSDPKWKGAASDKFLKHAVSLANNRGGKIINVDLTIMCEAPKIGPHRGAIRMRIAEILSIDVDQVSVKATTTERLGFTGREEGIAAQAVANVAIPRF